MGYETTNSIIIRGKSEEIKSLGEKIKTWLAGYLKEKMMKIGLTILEKTHLKVSQTLDMSSLI